MTGKIREVREEEIIMDKLESDFNFKFMSLSFKIRDLFLSPKNLLKEVGIKPGFYVLDYGCGPGSYINLLRNWWENQVKFMPWISVQRLFRWFRKLLQKRN